MIEVPSARATAAACLLLALPALLRFDARRGRATNGRDSAARGGCHPSGRKHIGSAKRLLPSPLRCLEALVERGVWQRRVVAERPPEQRGAVVAVVGRAEHMRVPDE